MSLNELHKLIDEIENIMTGKPADDCTFDPADLGIEIDDIDPRD